MIGNSIEFAVSDFALFRAWTHEVRGIGMGVYVNPGNSGFAEINDAD